MAEYKVKFEVFEGPLDLLLYLIRKEEVDIYEVNLTKLATQFIEYIDLMRMLDLDIAGEFLVMASTLMYIKSKELLPVDQQVLVEDEDEGEDPRWELIRQLVEYKKFKDAAARLQQLETIQENTYPRLAPRPDLQLEPVKTKPEVSLFDLVNAVNSILKRVGQREDLREIFEERFTVSEKIEHLLNLVTQGPMVRFSTLFAEARTRSEVVVTFLALLELIRLKQLAVIQSEQFGEIEITRVETPVSAEAIQTIEEEPSTAEPPIPEPAAPAETTES
jgi:segregation and condensation protein A